MPTGRKSPVKRRDAIENRERILTHAERLFATDGFEVGFHRIARELNIGVGTVYRHFPDRDALLLALYESYQQRINELGAQFLAAPAGMPRVTAFIDGTTAFSLRRPVARRVAAWVQKAHPERVAAAEWAGELATAIEEAQAAGDLRPDATATDVAVLAGMVADLVTIAEPQRSLVLPRMRAYVLDSLRPDGVERPDLPSEPLSIEDITVMSHQPGRA